MKNLLSIPALGKTVLALLFVLTLASCSSSSSQDGPAPLDAFIIIEPDIVQWEVTEQDPTGTPPVPTVPCGGNPPLNAFNTQLINITVFDAFGNALGDVDLDIGLDLTTGSTSAGGSLSLIEVLTAFDDFNGNNQADAGEQVLSTTTQVVYSTETDELGSKQLFLRVDLGNNCEFGGTLTVVSGSIAAFLEIDKELN